MSPTQDAPGALLEAVYLPQGQTLVASTYYEHSRQYAIMLIQSGAEKFTYLDCPFGYFYSNCGLISPDNELILVRRKVTLDMGPLGYGSNWNSIDLVDLAKNKTEEGNLDLDYHEITKLEPTVRRAIEIITKLWPF